VTPVTPGNPPADEPTDPPEDSVDAGCTAAPFSREELQSLQILASVDLARIEPLLRSCEVRALAPGETLIAGGAPNHYLYLLLAGRLSIHLEKDRSEPIATIEAGESVGEISLIDRNPASADVVAEIPSRVLVLDEEIMWILADTSHAISSNLLHVFARRLRFGNTVIHRDREQLREVRFQATVDALTGLYNRHWLNTMLPRQMQRSRRSAAPLALIMVDIDHFKRYNDSHGHVAGDCALMAAAGALRDHIRPADMAARYGGEEFVVLLPDSDLAGAHKVADRLLSALSDAAVALPHGVPLPSVTASFGIAQMSDEEAPEDLLTVCDAALYRAKLAGRARVSK